MAHETTTSPLFAWTTQRRQAAFLVAEDRLSDAQIAAEIGGSRRQLARWKAHPLFAEQVATIIADQHAALRETGITEKQVRVADLGDLRRRLWHILQARAADPSMQGVPGGATGLLVGRTRVVGAGGRVAVEYRLDVALLREMRALLKQASMELGQWGQPLEVGATPVAPATFTIVGNSEGERGEELSPLAALPRPGRGGVTRVNARA